MTSDRFGVPERMFGSHPEAFFSVVGRIVALSALLENKVLTLTAAASHEDVNGLRKQQATSLLKLLRASASNVDISARQELMTFIDDSARAFEKRHAVVHSVWPAQPDRVLRGWRPDRGTAGDNGAADWYVGSLEELTAEIPNLVRLVQVSSQLLAKCSV